MPKTLTLEGISDELLARLRASAKANRRSLNHEIIARLQAQLLHQRASAQEHLAAIRAVRAQLAGARFDHAEIDGIKRPGRA